MKIQSFFATTFQTRNEKPSGASSRLSQCIALAREGPRPAETLLKPVHESVNAWCGKDRQRNHSSATVQRCSRSPPRESVSNTKTELPSHLQNYSAFQMDDNYIIIDLARLTLCLYLSSVSTNYYLKKTFHISSWP